MMIKKSFSSKLIDMIVTTFPHNHDQLIWHPNASMFPNTTTTLLALLNDISMLTLGEMRKGPSNTIKVLPFVELYKTTNTSTFSFVNSKWDHLLL